MSTPVINFFFGDIDFGTDALPTLLPNMIRNILVLTISAQI